MTEEEIRRSTRRSEEKEIPPWASAQGRVLGEGTGWGRGLGNWPALCIKCTIAGGGGGGE